MGQRGHLLSKGREGRDQDKETEGLEAKQGGEEARVLQQLVPVHY